MRRDGATIPKIRPFTEVWKIGVNLLFSSCFGVWSCRNSAFFQRFYVYSVHLFRCGIQWQPHKWAVVPEVLRFSPCVEVLHRWGCTPQGFNVGSRRRVSVFRRAVVPCTVVNGRRCMGRSAYPQDVASVGGLCLELFKMQYIVLQLFKHFNTSQIYKLVAMTYTT